MHARRLQTLRNQNQRRAHRYGGWRFRTTAAVDARQSVQLSVVAQGCAASRARYVRLPRLLARDCTVVCTDLRGYGDPEKPPGGEDHSGYSFRAMAQDQV